jgi:hypothetical protein
MEVVNEKVLIVTFIAVFYVVTSLVKPQTILRRILNSVLVILIIIWALDFFNIYLIKI